MIFLGTHLHNIDSKNRLTLPAKFASQLGQQIVISKGFDGCLEIRSAADFDAHAQKLLALAETKKDARIVVRQLLANAENIEIDTNRRALIPANLLKETNIKKDVTLIGLGNKIEMWDSATYNKYKADTDKTFVDVADKLEDK